MQDMDVKQLLARVHEIRNLDQLGENASTVLHFYKNDKTGKEIIPFCLVASYRPYILIEHHRL